MLNDRLLPLLLWTEDSCPGLDYDWGLNPAQQPLWFFCSALPPGDNNPSPPQDS